MSETGEIKLSDGGVAEPLTLQQRRARGFCTCPLRLPDGSATTLDPEPCRVHPKHLVHSADYNQSHRLLFFDDRRNRYVTWEDAVESMRQPRYAGATSKELIVYTWMNLMRLLDALRSSTGEPAMEITEQSADRLITWAGQNFPSEGLASLIGFARGGGTEGLCQIFRTVARLAQSRLSQGTDATASAPHSNSHPSPFLQSEPVTE